MHAEQLVLSAQVLSRLVCVAEELNKAQAQIELRKILKRHEEAAAVPMSVPPCLHNCLHAVTDTHVLGSIGPLA